MNDTNTKDNASTPSFLLIVKEVQKYASPLVLIPLIIGGLWQLLALSSIDLSYIRFFSVSQMIPDGLVVVFLLAIIYLTIIFTFPSFEKQLQAIKNGDILLNISQFVFLSPPIFWFAYVVIYDSSQLTSTIFWVLAPLALIISTYSLISLALAISKTYKRLVFLKPINRSNEIFKLAKIVFVFYIFTGLLVAAGFIALQFHKIFLISTNLSNINNICAINSPECKILYFNDKYIFVKKYNGNKSYIEVKKFDAFFSEKPNQ